MQGRQEPLYVSKALKLYARFRRFSRRFQQFGSEISHTQNLRVMARIASVGRFIFPHLFPDYRSPTKQISCSTPKIGKKSLPGKKANKIDFCLHSQKTCIDRVGEIRPAGHCATLQSLAPKNSVINRCFLTLVLSVGHCCMFRNVVSSEDIVLRVCSRRAPDQRYNIRGNVLHSATCEVAAPRYGINISRAYQDVES